MLAPRSVQAPRGVAVALGVAILSHGRAAASIGCKRALTQDFVWLRNRRSGAEALDMLTAMTAGHKGRALHAARVLTGRRDPPGPDARPDRRPRPFAPGGRRSGGECARRRGASGAPPRRGAAGGGDRRRVPVVRRLCAPDARSLGSRERIRTLRVESRWRRLDGHGIPVAGRLAPRTAAARRRWRGDRRARGPPGARGYPGHQDPDSGAWPRRRRAPDPRGAQPHSSALQFVQPTAFLAIRRHLPSALMSRATAVS